VITAFDKKGPHAGKFSVKYKDDPNWWTHSLLREGYGKDKHWARQRWFRLKSLLTVAAGGPIFCFVVLLKSLMTVVKSVSDGLRDCESETQLNLDRPLRISTGPRHLSRPLST
jgi:hypothetical protein